MSVLLGSEEMPSISSVKAVVENYVKHVYLIDADGLAVKAGLSAAKNVVILGAFSRIFPRILNKDVIVSSIGEVVPGKYFDKNLLAFKLGYDSMAPTDKFSF